MSKRNSNAGAAIQEVKQNLTSSTTSIKVAGVYFVVPMNLAGRDRRMLASNGNIAIEVCCVYNACFLRVRSPVGVELIPIDHCQRLVLEAASEDNANFTE